MFVTPGLQLGGAERHIVLLARHLDRARWQPRVLAFGGGPFQDELAAVGVPVDFIPPPAGAGGVLRTAAAVRRYLRRVRPSVVTVQHIAADVPVRVALSGGGWRGRRPAYVVWKHTYGHIGARGARERAVEALLGSQVTRYAAVCFSQVTYLRTELGLPTTKLSVVQNSLPASVDPGGRAALTAALGREPRGPVAIVVGVLRADKGHRTLLRAWQAVEQHVPGATLVVVGDGEERVALETQARDTGLRDVHFLGSRLDAPLLASGADVFVLASYNIECFPYAVLEAMAGGKPVVSTHTGGLAEMVDHGATGLLVPPEAPGALGDALLEVLAGPARAAELGAAGRRRLEEVFPFDRWTAEVNCLYAELQDAGGSRA